VSLETEFIAWRVERSFVICTECWETNTHNRSIQMNGDEWPEDLCTCMSVLFLKQKWDCISQLRKAIHILVSLLHNSQGQFGGNLFKKVITEHFPSFSSITKRYQECYNMTAIVLKNKITFFISISLAAICECHIWNPFFSRVRS